MIFAKSSNLNDAVYGKSIVPIQQFMVDEEQQYLKASQLDKVFKMITSNQFAYSETEMTSKGNFQDVGESGAYPRTSQQQGYKKIAYPAEWKLSMEITETMIEDAEAFDPVAFAKDFMLPYTRTREEFGALQFNSGTAATATYQGKTYDITCADGLALFSTGHTSITGGTGTQSNLYDAPFSYDNLLYAEEKMQDFTDDNGYKLNVQPDTIICPNDARLIDLIQNAIYTTSGKPGSANAGTNTNGDRWNLIVWPRLKKVAGGQSPVYLMDSKRAMINGGKFIDRTPLAVNDWKDNNTGNLVFGGRARFNFMWNSWKNVLALIPGSGGSSL